MFKPLTGARPAVRVSVAFIILALAASAVFAGLSYAARPAQAPPPPPPLPLGNPTGLTAVPGSDSGDVLLKWTPAVGATLHIVYLIKVGGDDGRYWPALAGDADTETITRLEPGQEYLFIVIAGREQGDDGSFQWSEWSNWARGRAGTMELPTPPSTPASTPGSTSAPGHGESGYRYAEIEGVVVSLDTAANTFDMNVREYEHLGGTRPQSPVTVDYGSVEFVENWLRTGLYVEAEGTYYPSGNVLVAYEVEAEDSDDDDDDDDDRDDDDDDDRDDDDDDDDH